MAERIHITPGALSIDPDEIEISFVRSPGPGGQNVNKVATAAQLRFDLSGSPSLPAGVKARALRRAGTRATTEGAIVMTGSRHRSQQLNREDVIARLVELLRESAQPPRPRIPTRPTLGAKTRRLESKVKRGGIKLLRSGKPPLE